MQGKGNVIRRMFADVEADIYVLVDGDNTYDAASAPKLIAVLVDQRLDMVNAARKAVSADAWRAGHAFGNALFTGLVATIFGDRFDDIDLVDLLDRPASEIVARIAADLGLPPSWSRMAEEAWAEAERTESDPGAPLMALLNPLETVRPAAPPGARRAPRGEPPDAVLDFRYRKRRRAPGVWESLEPMDAAEA